MPTRPRKPAHGAGSPDALGARHKRLAEVLERESLAGLLIDRPQDIRYLTGFHGDASMLVFIPGRSFLVSDFRFEEELQDLAAPVRVVIRSGAMIPALADSLKQAMPGAKGLIGLQSEYLTLATRADLQKAAKPVKFKETRGLVAGLRAVKDDSEIATIRKAIRIQEASLLAVLPTIKAGQREADIVARLEFEMKQRGASGASFSTIVAARSNSSLPHAIAGGTRTAVRQPLLIDWGARLDGYAGDMTRTFSLGAWSKKMREIYGIVLEAHDAAFHAVRAGASAGAVHGAAQRVIESAGYGTRFGHGVGHGLGLDVHEGPRLGRGETTVLCAGMVVTIEPGIYLPGIGGVRIEDDVLVTDRSGKRLSSLPRGIDWATL